MSSELILLREVLRDLKVDAFIVGSEDAHQSEYVCEHDKRREFISKFTGSAGTAIILQDVALLWTDGRYFLQAAAELSSEWTLMKRGEPGVLEINEWLGENMKHGQTVGIDPSLMSAHQVKTLSKDLSQYNLKVQRVKRNPIDDIWETVGRPSIPTNPLTRIDIFAAGKSHSEKISDIRMFLVANKADAIVFSMLDEVMWLFNVRGGDIPFNPVAICFALITLESAYLFADPEKISPDVQQHLLLSRTNVCPYLSMESFLSELASSAEISRVLVDPVQLNCRMYDALGEKASDKQSPITLAKSLKNPQEIEGIRQCHIRDGVALTAFFAWLEGHLAQAKAGRASGTGSALLTEFDIVEKLIEFRSRMEGYRGPSFETIAGYGSNGAIIHYKPGKLTSAVIGTDSLLLIDSGGQYIDGTTDVTRYENRFTISVYIFNPGLE
jgi:Xaa-Pro aminopeptidase